MWSHWQWPITRGSVRPLVSAELPVRACVPCSKAETPSHRGCLAYYWLVCMHADTILSLSLRWLFASRSQLSVRLLVVEFVHSNLYLRVTVNICMWNNVICSSCEINLAQRKEAESTGGEGIIERKREDGMMKVGDWTWGGMRRKEKKTLNRVNQPMGGEIKRQNVFRKEYGADAKPTGDSPGTVFVCV